MVKVGIGSKNPAKVSSVEQALSHWNQFDLVSVNVPSGVSEQPLSDQETINGALNRAQRALKEVNGDIGIGLEGGVQETEQGLFLCNWGALVAPQINPIVAGGARISLPEDIAERLRAGEELGPIMVDFANKENVRSKEGAVGIFTNGMINRSEMFTHIMKLLVGQYEYQVKKK
jgi:inosine/xanthosine triphosphatase